MQTRLAAILTMWVFAIAPAVLAGGKAQTKAVVSFHMETDANDNPKMMLEPQRISGQIRYFRRMPEITTKDVVSFNPFPSDAGGDDYGIAFRLNASAATRLAAITNASQGRWLLSEINGRIVDAVLIDKQIDDGFLMVWKGATLTDVKMFDSFLPRCGQEGKKPQKSKKK